MRCVRASDDGCHEYSAFLADHMLALGLELLDGDRCSNHMVDRFEWFFFLLHFHGMYTSYIVASSRFAVVWKGQVGRS